MPFDPDLFAATAQTGNHTAPEVLDRNIGLPENASSVHPGRTFRFWIGFSVANMRDLTVDIDLGYRSGGENAYGTVTFAH